MRINSKEKLVSIIMPAYNSADFISQAIESVQNQEYSNWELLIVDDCSSDDTVKIIDQYSINDKRIKLTQLKENSGAAVARNVAIEKASGDFLAFLDSDDYWKPEKLSTQITFMEKNDYLFTCTSYKMVDDNSKSIGKKKIPNERNDYDEILKNSPGNSTVIYNAEKLGKFFSPNIRRRNDYVMWLQVIKKAKTMYGIQKTLTFYRVRTGSLSKNKIKLVKYQWKVYREIEKLPLFKSIYLLVIKVYDVINNK